MKATKRLNKKIKIFPKQIVTQKDLYLQYLKETGNRPTLSYYEPVEIRLKDYEDELDSDIIEVEAEVDLTNNEYVQWLEEKLINKL